MSKRKNKKSKNTMLIVFLVITFIIAIALLLYFFLWKENYGEIRENMTDGGQGKGYDQQCNTDKKCKGNLTCTGIKQGKGTCKCKPGNIHFSELTEEQKPFFKGDVCIPKNDLEDLGEQGGCEEIFNGTWDGSKCLPPGTKIASEQEKQISPSDYIANTINQMKTINDDIPRLKFHDYFSLKDRSYENGGKVKMEKDSDEDWLINFGGRNQWKNWFFRKDKTYGDGWFLTRGPYKHLKIYQNPDSTFRIDYYFGLTKEGSMTTNLETLQPVIECTMKCLKDNKICPANQSNGLEMVQKCCKETEDPPNYVRQYLDEWC